jgi:Ni,Fe-hydrogenase I cytochrome b subunit
MLLHPEQVQDIGYIIRDIMLQKQQNDVLFKLYQYTMPFIKHNRLNFPPMQCTSRVVLRHMIQVMALTCLGLYSPKNKKPTWSIRRQLFSFFTTLMTRGSLRDVYLFCLHNTYVLRLALMEHFIFFSSTHMQEEMKLLARCGDCRCTHARGRAKRDQDVCCCHCEEQLLGMGREPVL